MSFGGSMKTTWILIFIAALLAVSLVVWSRYGSTPRRLPPIRDLNPTVARAPLVARQTIKAGRSSNLKKARPPAECLRTYVDFYRDSPTEIRVVFGYKDARPARFVGDRYERLMFVEQITSQCSPGLSACDFARDRDDADLFYKSVTGVDGRPRQLILRVVNSSVGPDDDQNRRDRFQTWQSRYARDIFLSGLSNSEVVFYDGHSRDGGGPDFSPPRLRGDKAPHYYWYSKARPGFKDMIGAVSDRVSRLKLIGLFSCGSEKHFAGPLANAKPGLGMIVGQELTYYSDAVRQMLGALSALLGLWCEEDFQGVLKNNSQGNTSPLRGFFR